MKPKRIFVHCSDSTSGDVEEIDEWHRKRGWRGIGYHAVVLNGRTRRSRRRYRKRDDGGLEWGRRENVMGAGVKGHNRGSLHVCLIGKTEFTDNQRRTLLSVLFEWMVEYDIPPTEVHGHYEFDDRKTCPNLEMKTLRGVLANAWQGVMNV